MKSEFTQLDLGLIRYSLVWEDSYTLYKALDISTHDHLLVITSAGCNVLNVLLKNPASVTAIDLNPFQNKLLLLKKHIILNHEYEVFYALLGFAGEEAVNNAKQELIKTLPVDEQPFWLAFFDEHPNGLLSSGKLEAYITSFYSTLSTDIQETFQQLLRFMDVKAQYEFFKTHLHTSTFKADFIAYYSDENLQKGRDSKLLKYAAEPIGPTFYKRLLKQLNTALVRENFHFRFFFFGLQGLPDDVLPPCYRRENYEILKQRLHKVSTFEGEALDFILSEKGWAITKAALSNIFEYISQEEFDHMCKELVKGPDRKLRFAFWNLLNGQGEEPVNYKGRIEFKNRSLSPFSSFYFKNVIQMELAPRKIMYIGD